MITHAQAAKQAATDAVVDLADGGGGSNATFELLDGATILSQHAMSNPAFGSADSSGLAASNAIASDTSANADGTADSWRVKNTAGTVVMTGQAGKKYAIIGATTGAGGTLTIDGDHTTEFAAGTDFNVVASTGNDGGYTVASVELSGGDTVITVEADQTIADATVDGSLHRGEVGLDNDSIATGQTVAISGFSYRALRS